MYIATKIIIIICTEYVDCRYIDTQDQDVSYRNVPTKKHFFFFCTIVIYHSIQI